jgi:hypothetical protein
MVVTDGAENFAQTIEEPSW